LSHKFDTIMAYAKTELFGSTLATAAMLFKALAHPARLAILQCLADKKVCVTGDISGELPLSRTTVNQHLAELKKAGLIQGTINGTKVNYCLDPVTIRLLNQVAWDFFEKIRTENEIQCR
jgi:ArsR family transcriptional regulator, arsenate/arsenite/antimonite-responsive transcriptional repressor